MSQIRDKDTKPEVITRRWLWHNGYRYRLHCKDLPGKPDIVFTKQKKVIFVNGCFWHKHDCEYFRWPKTNADFWKKKILSNVERDKNRYLKLEKKGWRYMIVWACQLRNENLKSTWNKVSAFLSD
jgi:DNA mismatch endonuclease (patch repair protein)